MKDEVQVYIQMDGSDQRVGTLHRQPRRGFEAVGFHYHPAWLTNPGSFSLQPSLALDPAPFTPPQGQSLLGALGDSAPDTWGRSLMLRAERRAAKREGRPVQTLHELDFLLGVTDTARSGALRFKHPDDDVYLAPDINGVPTLVHVQRLLEATDRTLRNEETEEDLRLLLAPGSSLGGARPKASVWGPQGELAIAKFPKPTDEYSIERWEAVALVLARQAGINATDGQLLDVAGGPVLLTRRFDRAGNRRVPFLSALAMLDLRDREPSSYPDIVDAITEHGANAKQDAAELYKRMAFNVLISNVDDHMRNHAFLWAGPQGWTLSPAYDLNPTPVDTHPRILTTAIHDSDGTCDLALVLTAAGSFGLNTKSAKSIIKETAAATSSWRDVASSHGATRREIERMSSAFEHEALRDALEL